MTRQIGPDLITEKNKLQSLGSWIWLIEADIDGTNSINITPHDTSVTFDGKTYDPYPCGISAIEEDTEGNNQAVSLTVSNIDFLATSYINDGDIDGRSVWVRLVHEDYLSDSSNVLETEWQVQSVSYDQEAATFKLGMVNLISAEFPRERYFRTRCRYVSRYGGLHCGYDTSLPNKVNDGLFDPTTCDGGLDTDNGCRKHGDNEVNNGLPRCHPGRYGGFPSLLKGRVFLV